MAKMTQYSEAERFDAGDILIKDGANGTKKIKVRNASYDFAGLVSSYNHRNVYRGKNLGTSITESQMTAISNGTFDDIFIGDYWTVNERRYVVADMDYWYNFGDEALIKHHIVLIPYRSLYSRSMNATDTTEGGYVGSNMYTTGLTQARNTIGSDFGNRIITHRELLCNAVTDGKESASAWFDSTADLMTETMVFGCNQYKSISGDQVPIHNIKQLALFGLHPNYIGRYAIWLRDIATGRSFCSVNPHGDSTFTIASAERGVLPVFAIGSND